MPITTTPMQRIAFSWKTGSSVRHPLFCVVFKTEENLRPWSIAQLSPIHTIISQDISERPIFLYDAPGTPGGVCRIDADVVRKVKPAVVKKASKK